MSIKDIGAIKDIDGREVRIGWESPSKFGVCAVYHIFLRFKDSWWIKQEGVEVRSSEEAHAWTKGKVEEGKSLRGRNKGSLM